MTQTPPVPAQVFDLPDQAGQAAGRAAAELLRGAITAHGSARVILASAPSQATMLATLVRQDVDWSRVHALHMDEYIGLPPDHPQSFGQWLADRLPPTLGRFDRLLPGDDPAVELARYTDLLAEPVDLVCMGIGVNGHIAFNEPGSSFTDDQRVRLISLDLASRRQQVDDDCFRSLDEVPTGALTVTIPTLMAARSIVCTVIGARKAAAVEAALTGPVDESCPGSVLQTRTDAAIFVDRAAGPGFARDRW